jgi:hypothetical protein
MESETILLLLDKNVSQWKVDAEEKAVRKAMIDSLTEDDKLLAQGDDAKRKEIFEKKSEDLLNRYRANRDKGYEQVSKEAQYDIMTQRFDKVRWLYWVATVIGGLLMIVGVTLWYKRVQRPQEILMKKQIEA